MPQWSLELASGARVKLTRGVTTIGRSSRCDIVIPDRAVSRRQALLAVREGGLELIDIGKRGLIEVSPTSEDSLLDEGAQLSIGGQSFARVLRERDSLDAIATSPWCVRVDGGPLLAIPAHGLALGGAGDDLELPAWSGTRLALHLVGVVVVAEHLGAGEPKPPFDGEGIARLESATSFELDGVTIALVEADNPSLERSTLAADRPRVVIKLERFDAGGMVTYGEGPDATSVFLAARRFALVEALLTEASESGEPDGFHSVDALCRSIWPDDPIKDRTDFNVLLHRVRRDFHRAGIDVDRWFERKRGTGMIRAPILAAEGLDLQRI